MAKEEINLSQERWRLYTAAAIAVITLIYLGTRSQAYNFDGTVFALYLRYSTATGDLIRVVHPHHLLYQPLAHLFYRALELLSYEPVTIFALELMSTLFGLFGLILFLSLLKKLGHPPMIRFFFLLVLAFSFGYYLFSLEAEVYIISCFFLTATFLSFITALEKKSAPLLLLAGILFGLSVLAHITNFLLLPACLYLLKKREPKSYLCFIGPALLLPASAYGIVIMSKGFPNLSATLSWFLGAAANQMPGTTINRWSASPINPWISLKTLGEAVVTSKLYPEKSLPLLSQIVRYLVLLFAFLLFLLPLLRIRKKEKIFIASLIWFCSYLVFFSFWDVGALEFFVAILIPFTIILSFGGRELLKSLSFRRGIALFSLFIGLLFLINFTYGIKPRTKAENNLNYQKALFVKEKTKPSDVVVILGYPGIGFNYGKIYIPYFAEREVIILDWLVGKGDEKALSRFENLLRGKLAAGKRVFLLSEVIDDCPARRAFLKSHRITKEIFEGFIHRFVLIPEAEFSPDFRLIRLLPPPNYLKGN